jgi:HAD superfamily hydrolase (TIGR01509 family)
MPKRLLAVFFDIGRTLGELDPAGKLVLYPDTKLLVAALTETLHLRAGIITNAGSMKAAEVAALLAPTGLAERFELARIVTSADAGVEKPDPAIYRFAAERLGLVPGECLYLGDDPKEVEGAVRAGFSAAVRVPPM